ncbi:MAG: hypothetical protein R3F61_03045 [Myxococcota bacterium]
MSATKTAAVVLTLAAGPCSGGDPEPAPASYSCEHAFDAGCRYRATVDLHGGTLAEAEILPLPDFGASSRASFEGLAGTVTIADLAGSEPSVTCGFTVDLDFHSDTMGGRAVVTTSGTPTFEPGCPLTCAWFLPGSGDYAATGGHFRMKMFEGQWELEFGASEPDSPEYGPSWLYSESAPVDFGEGATLVQPTPIGGGTWTVPMHAPLGSYPDTVCPG